MTPPRGREDPNTIVNYRKIEGILRNRGRTEPDIENIMWRNWVRLFSRALPGH